MTDIPNAPPAPKAPTKKQSPQSTIPEAMPLTLTTGVSDSSSRSVVFGTGGIGKSTLGAYLPAPLFIDVEGGTRSLNILRDGTVRTWRDLRGKLATIERTPPEGVRSIVIDSATVCEELAKEFVVQTRTTEKGKAVDSIEGFGWGKGWQFVYDEFNGLLADLDRLVAKGLHVCLIAHDVASPVPNPGGEDFIRWEPLLYSGDKKGRGSIRERVKNWADHVLFIGYDVFVEDGKGRGSGSRTTFTQELPTHLAKSRTVQTSVDYDLNDPGAIWRALGIV